MKKVLWIALLALCFGCAGKDRVELLTERADSYNRSLRWSSLTAASSMIAPDNRRTIMNSLSEDMSRRRIVDYSIVDLSVDKEKIKGTVIVEVSFYNVSDQNLQYRQEMQTWEYNAKQANWFISQARVIQQGAANPSD